MDGLLVILAGIAALVGAVLLLRSFGPRGRVGRLLAAAPAVSVAEAVALARAGRAVYVRVTGRIDSETDFEDADHRPLVYRRTRFQAGADRQWTDFDVIRETVPFEIHEGLDAIAVDAEALGDGLVVVPRETAGVVGDLGDRAPEGVDPTLPARVVVEHVSSVEHATVAGVPALGADGVVRLGAGLGRPLILTTLADPEAMRILALGTTGRPRIAAALLVVAAGLLVLGVVLLVLPGSVLAASPEPTGMTGADTRSSGEGPGIVGSPLLAVLAVLGIGLLALIGTLAWVRATGGAGAPRQRR